MSLIQISPTAAEFVETTKFFLCNASVRKAAIRRGPRPQLLRPRTSPQANSAAAFLLWNIDNSPFIDHRVALDLRPDLICHRGEDLVDRRPVSSARAEECCVVLIVARKSQFFVDCNPSRQVDLIWNERHNCICSNGAIEQRKPMMQRIERLSVRDIMPDNCAIGAAQMNPEQALGPFPGGSVSLSPRTCSVNDLFHESRRTDASTGCADSNCLRR